MAATNPVGWFEIPVKDMKRAISFYQKVFGVKLEQHKMGENDMAWFPMDMKLTGAAGTLIKGKGYKPSIEGVLIYFTAPKGDIKLGLKRVVEQKGKVLADKMPIGEHGFIGLFADSEGNRIALHSIK